MIWMKNRGNRERAFLEFEIKEIESCEFEPGEAEELEKLYP